MKKFFQRFCQILSAVIVLCALYILAIMVFVGITEFGVFSNLYWILFLIWLIGGIYGFIKMGKGIKLQDQKTFTRGAMFGVVLPIVAFVVYLLMM